MQETKAQDEAKENLGFQVGAVTSRANISQGRENTYVWAGRAQGEVGERAMPGNTTDCWEIPRLWVSHFSRGASQTSS